MKHIGVLRRTGILKRDVERIERILRKARTLPITEEDAQWLEHAVKEGLRERLS